MNIDVTLFWTALVAAVAGVLCTLAVQLVGALRQAMRDVGGAARQISKVATALIPAAQGTERIAGMLGESKQDLESLQGSFHKLAQGSAQVSDSLQRVGRWMSIVTPVAVAVVERLTHEHAAPPRNRDEVPERDEQTASNGGSGGRRAPETDGGSASA
jgi:hypothetical protein